MGRQRARHVRRSPGPVAVMRTPIHDRTRGHEQPAEYAGGGHAPYRIIRHPITPTVPEWRRRALRDRDVYGYVAWQDRTAYVVGR